MHKYLKAIGFTELKKKQEIREILRQTADEFDSQQAVSLDETSEFYELKKQYGDSVGISVYGEMDQDKIFEREYYVPYFEQELQLMRMCLWSDALKKRCMSESARM